LFVAHACCLLARAVKLAWPEFEACNTNRFKISVGKFIRFSKDLNSSRLMGTTTIHPSKWHYFTFAARKCPQ